MALSGLIHGVRCLSLAPSLSSCSAILTATPLLSQVIRRAAQCQHASPQLLTLQRSTGYGSTLTFQREFSTPVYPKGYKVWKVERKYTIRPIPMSKTGGRDHTGRIRVHGIGGGHKQCYRMIDFHRLNYEHGKEKLPFQEKVILVRYDPCRSADIALLAGGKRKRWIIATENMKEGDLITTSGNIGRMAVSANEGDSYPVGALSVGTLINNLELQPGRGSQFIRAAGTSGILLRKVNGTAIVQLPSKRQIQVLETCMATVGRISNIDHNKRIIGKAGRNRWLGKRPSSGKWHRKGGWAGRKIRPLPPMKSYVNLPSVSSKVS